jgi:DNA-binding NtrC family response regulator
VTIVTLRRSPQELTVVSRRFLFRAAAPPVIVFRRGLDVRHERILIVDPDLGFLFWLGQTLNTAGYAALPAKGMREACALVKELSVRVDLLFVFPWMTGVDTFVNRFRSRHEGCIVIALCRELDVPLYMLEHVDKCWAKPDRFDAFSGMEWLEAIENDLRNSQRMRVRTAD